MKPETVTHKLHFGASINVEDGQKLTQTITEVFNKDTHLPNVTGEFEPRSKELQGLDVAHLKQTMDTDKHLERSPREHRNQFHEQIVKTCEGIVGTNHEVKTDPHQNIVIG